jgi:Tol biopolymer transport system component/DNA-binding winged helix-turn-helix (wHTH) protein
VAWRELGIDHRFRTLLASRHFHLRSTKMPSSARNEMQSAGSRPQRIAFDRFELNLRSGELRKEGHRIRLQAQPFQLLALLLEHGGEVVSREEVCRNLWQADTFVDFDHGVATAINKIREALGDSAENPRFVETLPKRGYRFIAEIKREAPLVVPMPRVDAERVRAATSEASSSGRWPAGWLRNATWILLGGAGALALAFGWVRWHATNLPPGSAALTVVPFTSYPGLEDAPSFSPDGSRVAFAWDGNGEADKSGAKGFDLYVKGIGSETLLRLTHHPAEWLSSAWSPDGTQIAMHRIAGADTGLYVVPALGGPERKLRSTKVPYNLAAPISWSADGKWIAYDDLIDGKVGDRMFLFSMETSESHLYFHDPSCTHEADLTFSHSGTQLAWVCVHALNSFEVFLSDISGQSRKSLTKLPTLVAGLCWSPDDSRLIVTQSNGLKDELYEVWVNDRSSRKIQAAPSGLWPVSSAKTGALAFSVFKERVDISRKDMAHQEAPAESMFVSSREENMARYSPDGKHIAFDSTRSGQWSVWLADADGSNLVQISHGGDAGYPRWSPDSQRIVYQQTVGDLNELYVADIAERAPRKLAAKITTAAEPFWARDGMSIYFQDYASFRHRYYRCSMPCEDATLVRDGPKAVNVQESLDGSAWYYGAGEGDPRVLREPFKDGRAGTGSEIAGMPHLVSSDLWTLGPGGIYFVRAGMPRTVSYFDFSTHQSRDLFTVDRDLRDGLSVSRDGRYFLLSQQGEKNSDIMMVENFR